MDLLLSTFRNASKLGDNEQTLAALRLHYADVCTDTDVIIHKILECLEKKIYIPKKWNDQCEHITYTLNAWIKAGEYQPEPLWGD
jgi:hypothetical protein